MKYLAYTDRFGIHLKLIETGETRTVPQPQGFSNNLVDWETYLWLPDSTRFLANSHPLGGDFESWSSRDTSVWIVSVLNGAPQKLRDHAYPYSVSPDGSLISFGANNGGLGDREIWVMRPDGGQARKVFENKENLAPWRPAMVARWTTSRLRHGFEEWETNLHGRRHERRTCYHDPRSL